MSNTKSHNVFTSWIPSHWRLHGVLILLSCGLVLQALQAPDLVTALRDESGRWALYGLIASLSFTPMLHYRPKWRLYLPWRRIVGLWAFLYAVVHLAVWIVLEFAFDWRAIADEIMGNLFIWLGLVSLFLLTVLAITSNRWAQRRRGFKAWQMLHQWTYPAIGLALSHYFMAQKLMEWQPMVLMLVFAVLMIWRYRNVR